MMYNVLTRAQQNRYLELMDKKNRIDPAYRDAAIFWDQDYLRAIPYLITAVLCLFIAPAVAPQWNDDPTVKNYLMLGVAFAVFYTPLCVLTYLHWELRVHIPRKARRYQAAEDLKREVDEGLARWEMDAEESLLAAGKWHVITNSDHGTITWEPRSVQTTVLGGEVWLLDMNSDPILAQRRPVERAETIDDVGTRLLLTEAAREEILGS